ncbi:MAG: aromatic ring-hydroxylating dioxygenase subunit alpha [Pseudomonadota bacterium]|nr:aromatic ring-hydroxylating dioxygenase subunit alpha [Pseudomonadota bacterium]
MFLKNHWYAAAFSGDIPELKPVARTLLNEPVVFFRGSSGKVSAVEDRCSHRAMPLSAGHVDGDVIRCAYHGVEFDGTGACAKIPNQDRVPASANIRAYPVVEKDSMIWIWMGEPAAADPSKIRDNIEHRSDEWSWKHFYFHVNCNWQLLVDNIFDLTHLAYIHANTIGGNPNLHFMADTKVRNEDGRVQLIRHMPNSVPPKSYVDGKGFKGNVDRWQEVEMHPESGMILRVNAGACDVDTGAYEGKRDHGFKILNVHCVTPETETSTHYSWSICTNADKGSGVDQVVFDQFYDTIREDEDALELQQMRINSDPARPFVGIASDGAVNMARKHLDKLARAEAQAMAAE